MNKLIFILITMCILSGFLFAQSEITINQLFPDSGQSGTMVRISGQGFSPEGNIIIFSKTNTSLIYRTKIIAPSTSGTSLNFKIPFYIDPICSEMDPPCTAPSIEVSPGLYSVTVASPQGEESNALAFEIVSCYCDLTISGRVTDGQGNGLSGMEIFLLNNQAAISDSNGYYSFVTKGTNPVANCPVGDTYLFVRQGENLLAERFIPVTCGNRTYDFKVSPTPIPPVPPGDANEDGETNIVDALLVAQYYVGNAVRINLSVTDVNCSNTVDIIDALLICQYYVKLITAFLC